MATCHDWSGERMAGLTNCQPQSPPTLKGRRGSALPPPYLRPTSALPPLSKAKKKRSKNGLSKALGRGWSEPLLPKWQTWERGETTDRHHDIEGRLTFGRRHRDASAAYSLSLPQHLIAESHKMALVRFIRLLRFN